MVKTKKPAFAGFYLLVTQLGFEPRTLPQEAECSTSCVTEFENN